jgi:hypothetical protein
MQRGVYSILKQVAFSSVAILLAALNPLTGAVQSEEQNPIAAQKIDSRDWQEFHSVAGRCKMKFPVNPEHVSEKMSVPEEGYDLKYDAYISSVDKRTVYMLLIAQYPDFVNEAYAQMSLEQFLNGILTHNPNNQLIFADLLLVNGHEALDFFIRSGSVYFKGRAMMVKNSLYLMAMECEMKLYDEGKYNLFVESFKFAQ